MDLGDATCHHRRPPPPAAAMGDPTSTPPPRSVAEILGTGRLPDDFARALSARFRAINSEGGALGTELRKGGEIHALLGHITAKADLSRPGAPGSPCGRLVQR